MTVIGSAYVNIRAITDKLESDIRSAIESITDSISIHVDADVSSATAKLDALGENLEDQTITVDADTSAAQRSLDELATTVLGDQTIHVTADTDDAVAALEEISRTSLQDQTITVDADTTQARAALDALSNIVLGDQTITIHVDSTEAEADLVNIANLSHLQDQTIAIHVDTEGAVRDLGNISNLSHLQDQTVHVGVDVDPTQAIIDLHAIANQSLQATVNVEADTLAAHAQLDDMSDDIHPNVIPDVDDALARARLILLTHMRTVRIHVQMNSGPLVAAGNAIARMTGVRVLSQDVGRLVKHFMNIDQAVPGIAKAATLIGSIGAMAVSSIGGLSTLGHSLLSIINMVGIAGPGMAVGFMVGIGTLMVALKDFSKQLPEVVEQYKTLATTIRSNFWDVARNPLREMAQTLFPAFQKGLADTGGALGRWTSTVAKSLQDALTENGRLDKMFGFLNTSIDKASKGSGLMADSLVVIGEAGGAVLPRLADWFTEVSTRFNNFIRDAAGNGDLDFWINSGIDDLKRLGHVIGETAGIFNKIDAAATIAGSDGLGTLLGFVTRVNDAIGSPEGMKAMVTIFEGSQAATAELGNAFFKILGAVGTAAPAIKSAFESIGGVVKVISDAIAQIISNPEFQAGFTAMFDGIQKGFEALMPVVGETGPKMGALLSIIGNLAANIGGVLGAALEVALPLITALKKAIDPLIPILGDALIKVIQDLGPTIQMFADAISAVAPVVAVVVGALADFIVQLVDTLAPAFPVIATGVLAFVVALKAASIVKDVAAGVQATVQAINFLRNSVGLATAAQAIFNIVMSANPIGVVIIAITALVAGFVLAYNNIGWFKDGVDAAMKWVGEAIGNLVSFWNTDVVPMWNNAMQAAGDFFGAIGAWVGDAIKNVQDFFGGFGDGAGEASGAVGGFFDGIGGMIGDALGGIGDFFGGIGKGISDAFNGVVDFISNIINTIVSVITTGVQIYIGLWVGAFTIMFDIFKNIWNGLISFFQPLIDLIGAIIKGVVDITLAIWQVAWDIISTIFIGVWTNLVRFFTPIIQGIQDAIGNAVNWVVTAWNTAWQGVSDFFTGIWNGIVAFVTPIVQAISDTITGIVNGIRDWWNTTWQNIVDYFTNVWNLMVAIYSPIIQNISDGITGFVNGVRDTWNAVWGAVGDFFSTTWNNIINFVTPIINTIRAVITTTIAAIQAGWNNTWNAIGDFFSTIWNNIVTGVTGFVNAVRQNIQNVMDTIGRIGSDIINNVSNFGTMLYNAGSDLIKGLANGITDMTSWVVDRIKGVGAGIVDGLKNFFGIKSPSRVMRDQVGKQLGLGLAIGIEASIGAVVKATEKLAAAAVPDIADIMLPAVKTASVASQTASTTATTAPVLTRESVTGTSATSTIGTNAFGTPNGGVTNVNFNVQTSPGLNEVQIGEHAMNYMYWKLAASTPL